MGSLIGRLNFGDEAQPPFAADASSGRLHAINGNPADVPMEYAAIKAA